MKTLRTMNHHDAKSPAVTEVPALEAKHCSQLQHVTVTCAHMHVRECASHQNMCFSSEQQSLRMHSVRLQCPHNQVK